MCLIARSMHCIQFIKRVSKTLTIDTYEYIHIHVSVCARSRERLFGTYNIFKLLFNHKNKSLVKVRPDII